MNRSSLVALLPLVALLLGSDSHEPVDPPAPDSSTEKRSAAEASTASQRASGSIGELAADAYGHTKFAGFLMLLHEIDTPHGTSSLRELETPPIAIAFQNQGLDPRYRPAIAALAEAADDFFELLPSYRKERSESGISGRGSFDLSADLTQRLSKNAERIAAAVSELENVAEPHLPPLKAVGQFRKASSLMRVLSTGAVDGYGYDYDLAGQRLGLGFEYAMIWVRNDHR